jgi:hypothetical protein
MPGESRRNWIIRAVRQAARWLLRSNRQIWLITLALVVVACGAAIGIPSARPELLACIFALGCAGWVASESSTRSRREREALAKSLKEAKDLIDSL